MLHLFLIDFEKFNGRFDLVLVKACTLAEEMGLWLQGCKSSPGDNINIPWLVPTFAVPAKPVSPPLVIQKEMAPSLPESDHGAHHIVGPPRSLFLATRRAQNESSGRDVKQGWWLRMRGFTSLSRCHCFGGLGQSKPDSGSHQNGKEKAVHVMQNDDLSGVVSLCVTKHYAVSADTILHSSAGELSEKKAAFST